MRPADDPALPYTLPDAALFELEEGFDWCCYTPPRPCIVIGKGNDYAQELLHEAIAADGLEVHRRPSGGHSVVLTPAMAVVSLVLAKRRIDREGRIVEIGTGARMMPPELFSWASALLIRALARLGVAGVGVKGTSDLTLGPMKFAGSSVYLGTRYSLYHAVVNLAEDPRTIARYLAMPPRQPDYRAGRGHIEFVTSLAREGHAITAASLAEALREELKPHLVQDPGAGGQS